MKRSLLIANLLLLASIGIVQSAEIKEVCHKETKKGKQVDVCKKIKVHKKLSTEK